MQLLRLIEKKHNWIVFVFFVAFLFVGLIIFENYGLSWDEGISRDTGTINLNFVLGKNKDLLTYADADYGPAFEMFLVSAEKIFHISDSRNIYLMRHLITFLLFYVSVIFFYLLCKRQFKDWKWGLLGGLFLILSPRIFANAFYNSKDLAFLSVFIISIYTLINYLDKATWLSAGWHAFVSALLIDIRIMGVIVPVFTFCFVGLNIFKSFKSKSRKIKLQLATVAFYGILLILLTILFWPILWDGPVHHFIEALRSMSKFRWSGTVLYLGSFVSSTTLPWHYIPVWIIITTPVLYTFSFLIGCIISSAAVLKKPFTVYTNNQKRNDAIFLLWFFLPLVAVIVLKSVVYDSWRQLFFVYPAFLLISLKGMVGLFNFIKLKLKGNLRKVSQAVLVIVVIVSLASTGIFMIKSHPYEHVYFNRLAGKNMTEVKDRFELDYWGLSYLQALAYILDNDQTETINVYSENYPGYLNQQILPQIQRTRINYVSLENATYFISNYRWHKEEYPYTNEFYSIKIDDANIMVVYNLTK